MKLRTFVAVAVVIFLGSEACDHQDGIVSFKLRGVVNDRRHLPARSISVYLRDHSEQSATDRLVCVSDDKGRCDGNIRYAYHRDIIHGTRTDQSTRYELIARHGAVTLASKFIQPTSAEVQGRANITFALTVHD